MEKFNTPDRDVPTELTEPPSIAGAPWLRTFAYYSANMQHLLPGQPLAAIYQSFVQTCGLRQRNMNPHTHLLALEKAAVARRLPHRLAQPGVIASFHYGAYPLLCGYLMACGIPFALVLSPAMYARQAKTYRELYRRTTGRLPHGRQFKLIDAGKPNSLLAMRQAIQEGCYLVCFVDGNTGVGRNASANLLSLPFLSGQLQVRSGAAFLSYLVGCPLYPVIAAETEQGDTVFEFGDSIAPSSGQARRPYMEEAMRVVYGFLETRLRQQASPWEAWMYIHGDMVIAEQASVLPHVPESHLFSRYAPFTTEKGAFVLDKYQYRAYRVPSDVHAKMAAAFMEFVID